MNIITSFNVSLNGILSEILSELADESNYYDDSLSEIRQSNKMIRSLKQIIDTLNIIEACNNSKDGCKERLLKKKEYKTYKMLIDELAEFVIMFSFIRPVVDDKYIRELSPQLPLG
ncbi:17036_t:CDS:2 [Entrophospora sp. SA101]|nr:17036_t:CDS:2 [Entrophospora sp. SA101]CAJ0835734.1 17611_t:CDS:2 [Entrophospora sp. SA101]